MGFYKQYDELGKAQDYLLRYAFRLNSSLENDEDGFYSDIQLECTEAKIENYIESIREKMKTVPFRHRLPVAFYISGFGYKDIANRLYLSCDKVKYHIETAKKYMHDNKRKFDG